MENGIRNGDSEEKEAGEEGWDRPDLYSRPPRGRERRDETGAPRWQNIKHQRGRL